MVWTVFQKVNICLRPRPKTSSHWLCKPQMFQLVNHICFYIETSESQVLALENSMNLICFLGNHLNTKCFPTVISGMHTITQSWLWQYRGALGVHSLSSRLTPMTGIYFMKLQCYVTTWYIQQIISESKELGLFTMNISPSTPHSGGSPLQKLEVGTLIAQVSYTIVQKWNYDVIYL